MVRLGNVTFAATLLDLLSTHHDPDLWNVYRCTEPKGAITSRTSKLVTLFQRSKPLRYHYPILGSNPFLTVDLDLKRVQNVYHSGLESRKLRHHFPTCYLRQRVPSSSAGRHAEHDFGKQTNADADVNLFEIRPRVVFAYQV